jgi:hypothetical protein
MHDGVAHAGRGEYAAALIDFLWCFDFGREMDSSFDPVRRSFLLLHIAVLGSSYPPALEAVRERRDLIRQKLYSGEGTADDAMDFAALNRALDDVEETVRAYDALKRTTPSSVCNVLFGESVPALVDARRYEEFVGMAVDIPLILLERLSVTREQIALLKRELGGADAAQCVSRYVIEESCDYYEVLLAIQRGREANAVANAVLTFELSVNAFSSLLRHAVRARDVGVAQALLRRAAFSLNETDIEEVRALAHVLGL